MQTSFPLGFFLKFVVLPSKSWFMPMLWPSSWARVYYKKYFIYDLYIVYRFTLNSDLFILSATYFILFLGDVLNYFIKYLSSLQGSLHWRKLQSHCAPELCVTDKQDTHGYILITNTSMFSNSSCLMSVDFWLPCNTEVAVGIFDTKLFGLFSTLIPVSIGTKREYMKLWR